MSQEPDDQKMDNIDALKDLINILRKVEPNHRERILRWTCEELDIKSPLSATHIPPDSPAVPVASESESLGQLEHESGHKDIRAFISEKNPRSDNHLAAVVAYFYQFQAPTHQRKEFITAEDLQEACRMADRNRLSKPSRTLSNAHSVGLLDKTGDRGAYRINTVGENLVAMTLPGGAGQSQSSTRGKTKKKKISKKSANK